MEFNLSGDDPRLQGLFWGFVELKGLVRMIDSLDPPEHGAEAAAWPEVQKLATDGEHVLIIGMCDRPGVARFCARLEHERYLPGTKYNPDFDLYHCVWGEPGPMFWSVIAIPNKDKGYAEAVAVDFGLRLATGIPRLFYPRENPRLKCIGATREVTMQKQSRDLVFLDHFPLGYYDCVYTLELARKDPAGIISGAILPRKQK